MKSKYIPKWVGPCDGCGEFNVLQEHTYDGELELLCNSCLGILKR